MDEKQISQEFVNHVKCLKENKTMFPEKHTSQIKSSIDILKIELIQSIKLYTYI